MKLAAAEHYFSDFFSVIETRRRSDEAIITGALGIHLPHVSVQEDPYLSLRSLHLGVKVHPPEGGHLEHRRDDAQLQPKSA